MSAQLDSVETALKSHLQRASSSEVPDAETCLKIAKCYQRLGALDEAYYWIKRLVDAPPQFLSWLSGSSLFDRLAAESQPPSKRTVRLALVSSYTTAQFAKMLRLAAFRRGIDLTIHESAYGQYQQDLLDPGSALYAADPDYVLIAPDETAVSFRTFSDSPDIAVAEEVGRWQSLWDAVSEYSRARVVQHTFAIKPESSFGHLAAQLPGSRPYLLSQLNLELGKSAGRRNVRLVDCERIASTLGKSTWFDERYWFIARQAVSLHALPHPARHTAAVLASCEGLSSKCLVLDLDNTLWGGIVGEDGLTGIKLGNSDGGEPFLALQQYVCDLKDRGVILAVASKNNKADAIAPFERHPEMRLRLEDISVFVASWDDKATAVRRVAETLSIELDALVVLDDNPAERALLRALLPEVEVIALPSDPAGFVRALSDSLLFESDGVTDEDRARATQYRARTLAQKAHDEAPDLESFYRTLEMRAVLAPFDELHLPRIAQLIVKTNQFNVTTRRHGLADIRSFMRSSDCVTVYLKLGDRFVNHGLVAVAIAQKRGKALEIDTMLMSCRVIGRTVEATLLAKLAEEGRKCECASLVGRFVPSGRNELARDVFARHEFVLSEESEAGSTWQYDLESQARFENPYIRVVTERDFDA